MAGGLALCGTRGFSLVPEPERPGDADLRSLLDPHGTYTGAKTLYFEFGLREFLREIGLDEGGKSRQALKDSLLRIHNISLYVDQNGLFQPLPCRFWSFKIAENTNRFSLAIHPLLAQTILGGQHTRLEMNEIRAIKGASTTILHLRLCGIINPGKTHDFTLDTLCEYIWPNKTEKTGTIRKRHFQIKQTIAELSTLPGWTLTEYAKNRYRISRPKPPKETAPISRVKQPKKAFKKGNKGK
jgi:hypothetical protein